DGPMPGFLARRGAGDGEVLVVEDLAKRFGAIAAVRDAGFVVRDASLHALIGPNGAGKTTAFNLLSGMFAPDRGRVLLGGESIGGLPPHAVCRRGLARSFQITNLFAGLTVEENLRLGTQATHASRFNPWRDATAIGSIR